MDSQTGEIVFVVRWRDEGSTWAVESRTVVSCHRRTGPHDRAIVLTRDAWGGLEAWVVGSDAFGTEASAAEEARTRNVTFPHLGATSPGAAGRELAG